MFKGTIALSGLAFFCGVNLASASSVKEFRLSDNLLLEIATPMKIECDIVGHGGYCFRDSITLHVKNAAKVTVRNVSINGSIKSVSLQQSKAMLDVTHLTDTKACSEDCVAASSGTNKLVFSLYDAAGALLEVQQVSFPVEMVRSF